MAETEFIETDQNRAALAAARSFNPTTDNLYLYGDVGTGKTMLAVKILRRAIQNGYESVGFIISEEFLRRLYGLDGEQQNEAIERIRSKRVLVIDEIGREPVKDGVTTEFSLRVLYSIINHRYNADRQGLVVTSNLPLGGSADGSRAGLAERFGDDRIPSRLGQMCKVIEIGGQDFRQAEAIGAEDRIE